MAVQRTLGAHLLAAGLVQQDHIDHALKVQTERGGRLGDLLVDLDYITDAQRAQALAAQHNLPYADLTLCPIDMETANRLPEEIARRERVLPLGPNHDGLYLAVADPTDGAALRQAEEALGTPVHPIVTAQHDLERALDHVYSGGHTIAALPSEDSARPVLTTPQKIALALGAGLFLAGLLINWVATLSLVVALISIVYLVSTFFKLYLVQRSFGHRLEVPTPDEAVRALRDEELPIYTILVPLYKEAAVLPVLVRSMSALEYPRDLLDIKLLLEEDDHETIAAARAIDLPSFFELVIVPPGSPRGKPRACNYGLERARGELLVIYDAEDVVDPQQLKKVLVAFAQLGPETVCVQAKLNYFNAEQNLLTRLFTAEYSMWFDLFLPGLQAARLPIPLGGTSNHFRTDILRRLGGWDAWNVTEDADLGLRLAKRGYKTAVIDSTTYEEANSEVYNWIRQRSRWIKGYVQTWLVHMRNPLKLWRELGPRGFFGFQFMVGGTFFTLLANPIFWVLTLIWALTEWGVINLVFDGPAFYLGGICLYIGNFALLYMVMAGCLARGYGSLVKYVLLAPFYWVLMSIAAWKGALQLITKPFYWEKTVHGLFQGVPHTAHSQDAAQVQVAADAAGGSLPAAQQAGAGSAWMAARPADEEPLLEREVGATPVYAAGPAALVATLYPTWSGQHLPRVRSARHWPSASEEAPVRQGVRERVRPPEWLAIWLISFVAMALTGVYALVFGTLYEPDALSRVYQAASVFHSDPPKLANIGFIWSPLPILLLLPLVLAQPLLDLLVPAVLLSAFFHATNLVVLNSIFRGFQLGRLMRYALLALYQANAMIFVYAINGMSESMMICFILLALLYLQRLRFEPNGDRNVVYLGVVAGLAFLVRYEGALLGPLLLVVVLAVLAALGKIGNRGLVEGHAVTTMVGFAYPVGLWLFFNWTIMGDPLYFLHGPGSNAEQSRQLIAMASGDVTRVVAPLTGSVGGALGYNALVVALVFPAAFVVGGLLLARVLRRDWFAASLLLILLYFPAFQTLMTYTGQSFGWARFQIYIIPVSFVGAAYLMWAGGFGRWWSATAQPLLLALLTASSIVTFYGLYAPQLSPYRERYFFNLLRYGTPGDELPAERLMADYIRSEVFSRDPNARILTDDRNGYQIILFSRSFDNFITPRNAGYEAAIADPMGTVDYVLASDVNYSTNRIVQAFPELLTEGEPFLMLEQQVTMPPKAGQENKRWWLFRVVPPGKEIVSGEAPAAPALGPSELEAAVPSVEQLPARPVTEPAPAPVAAPTAAPAPPPVANGARPTAAPLSGDAPLTNAGAPGAVAAPQPPASAALGDGWALVGVEAFDAPSEAWPTIDRPTWVAAHEGGRYRMQLAGRPSISYSAPLLARDFALSVDVEIGSGQAGLFFLLDRPNDFYRFLIDDAGRYRLEWQQVGVSQPLIDWTASDALRRGPGAVNRIEVRRAGDQLALFANGVLLNSYTLSHTATASGRMGLALSAPEGADTGWAWFDNLEVRGPQSGQ